jgi:Sap, sulfolipid-1-addressing protein
MPPQALSLALAASIYPPAFAAVIALGRGTDVRLRVVLFVGAAMFTVFATGALLLLLLDELELAGSHHRTPSAILEIAIGLILFGIAYWLRRPRQQRLTGGADASASRTERYLGSRPLVIVLGFLLYIVPSPVYLAVLNSVADANLSSGHELIVLGVLVVVMLWLIEVPMLMLLVFPRRATATLTGLNVWFTRNGRDLAALVSAVAGLYLIVAGLSRLI